MGGVRGVRFGAPFGVLALFLLPLSAPADSGNPNVIHACVNSAGILRIVGPTASCRPAEYAVHWAITGPQGPQGEPGAIGPAGPQGPAGPTNVFGLTVTLAGAGSGAVISSDDGISCGADCTEVYPAGTPVTLTAIPAAGSSFTGWSGDCSGTGSCTLLVGTTRVVIAEFGVSDPGGEDPPPPASDISGTYGLDQAAVYECALGLMSFNVERFVFTASASHLSVTGRPSLSPTMTGIASGNSFTVEATVAGDNTESYTLTGIFRADNVTWDGTFAFTCMGAGCGFFGCSAQSFAITGTRE